MFDLIKGKVLRSFLRKDINNHFRTDVQLCVMSLKYQIRDSTEIQMLPFSKRCATGGPLAFSNPLIWMR